MEKLRDRRVKVKAPWEEIKALYCAGYPAKRIIEDYPDYKLNAALISGRAQKEQWPTPHNLRKQAAALLAEASKAELGDVEQDPVGALVERIAAGKIEHQNGILDIVTKSLAALQKTGGELKVRDISDLEKIDKIGRRAYGLDVEEDSNRFSINIGAFGHAPRPVDV